MSSYLGRLLQATARSEPRLHPMAGSVYGERAAAIEQSLEPELGVPHWVAQDKLQSEQTPASPAARVQAPASTMVLEQHATPRPSSDLRRPGPAESNPALAVDSPGARPPDPIRATTPIAEPLRAARTWHNRDEAAFDANPVDDRPHSRLPRSETFAARADDRSDERSAAAVMGRDGAPAADELMMRRAMSPFVAEPEVRQPAWQQKPAYPRAEEPAVQVHIGRIEVLAVQPPAPAAPAPRRETATRLADYLAARNGSGR